MALHSALWILKTASVISGNIDPTLLFENILVLIGIQSNKGLCETLSMEYNSLATQAT